jgi:hypothetical protein
MRFLIGEDSEQANGFLVKEISLLYFWQSGQDTLIRSMQAMP